MSTPLRVGIMGATGALGAEVVRVLDRAAWRPSELVALARASTSTTHVDYGDEHVPVDDVEEEDVENLDALLLAAPAEAAEAVALRAMGEGVVVVDASGALEAHGVPYVVPWVNPEALLGDRPHRALGVPMPEALLLASVMGPLQRAGIGGHLAATVLAPASIRGRGGIDELASQVRALFNGEPPPRHVFETGLAFDLLPRSDALDVQGATGREAHIGRQLSALLGVPETAEITWVGVPVFSGVSATLTLRTGARLDAALVARILTDGGVVVVEGANPRSLPRPRKVEGHPFAHVGRVRVSEDGTLQLWASMDNLRTAATAMVAGAGALLEVGARAPAREGP